MIQNILTFCVKNDLTFVEGSIPSGKLVANDINRNSIYLVTPYDEAIVKANFQTNLQSDTPTSVLGILVNGKIAIDEIVPTSKSYYNLVKDWNIYEFKVPSTTLSFISRNRTGKIGINFSIEQRLVPTIKDSYGEYQGEILSQGQALTESGYYINKTIDFELDTGDVIIYDLNDILVLTKQERPLDDIQVKISAYSNRGSTPTTLYSVDPSLLNDNFETIEPSLTTQIVQQVNDNTGDIVLLFQNVGVNNATLVDFENRISVNEQDIDIAEANITNLQGRMATAESDIEDIEDGTTIVEKALKDSLGNVIKSTYANKLDLGYSSSNNRIAITLKSYDGTSLDADLINLPKATTLNDGLMAKEDKVKLGALPTNAGLTTALNAKVPSTRKILGIDLDDDVLLGEFKTALGEAITGVSGLMSATDKARLDALHALLGVEADADAVVSTINEVLAIFNAYPEGADLVSALGGKVDKVEGMQLTHNDYSDTEKDKVSQAHAHKSLTNNPHAVTFEQLGSKPTTLSGFGITDAYTKAYIDDNIYIKNFDIFDKSGYIDINGVLQSNNDWISTDYIDVSNFKGANVFANGLVSSVAFYTSGKVFISGITYTNAQYYFISGPIPENTKYVRVSTHKNYTDSYVLMAMIDYYIVKTQDEISMLEEGLYLKEKSVFTISGFINTSGVLTAQNDWLTTDYLDISTYKAAYVFTNNAVSSVSFYDENKQFISGLKDSGDAYKLFSGPIPENTKYVRVSTHKDYTDSYVLMFDYKNIVEDLRNNEVPTYNSYISVFHDNIYERKADWVEIGGSNNWTFDTTNHTITPISTGGYSSNSLVNVLSLNRQYAADMRTARVVVTLYSNTVMNIHCFRTSTTGQQPNESMFIIDCGAGKAKMCKNQDYRTVIPNEFVSTGDITISNGKKYIIEVIKREQHFELRVLDFASGANVGGCSIDDTWSGGTLIGKYGFSLGSGTPFVIHSFDVSILNRPNICIVGDSITEGTGATPPSKCFANLLRKKVKNSVISARASDGIQDVIARFDTEYSIIKPKILFVTIGTNDATVSLSDLQTIKTDCDNNGIMLYLNHIPTGTNANVKNAVIDELGVPSVMFDYVAHVGNNLSNAINTNLFPDNVHPNNAGSQAMYERIKKDTDLIVED